MVKQQSQRPSATPPAAPKKSVKDSIAAELGEQIGGKLRTMFDDVVAEPVPEKFRKLLEELERKSDKP